VVQPEVITIVVTVEDGKPHLFYQHNVPLERVRAIAQELIRFVDEDIATTGVETGEHGNGE
jgi:hypothetical protein